jgi:SAM-dependent methyltransferase
MSCVESGSFWETDEAVTRFAAREPDVRLLELLDGYPDPSAVRVLDLGCAAGRNTEVLAERGFDVFAIDGAKAMVSYTRERLAEVLGLAEADRRVRLGPMDDLGEFPDGTVRLVVALGILHQAANDAEWWGAIDEVSRVLARDGLLLVAAWSPRSRPDGTDPVPVPSEEHLYEGFHSGRHYLVDATFLDEAMASRGLDTVVPTEEVEVRTERGYRVTVNGLYQKTGA